LVGIRLPISSFRQVPTEVGTTNHTITTK